MRSSLSECLSSALEAACSAHMYWQCLWFAANVMREALGDRLLNLSTVPCQSGKPAVLSGFSESLELLGPLCRIFQVFETSPSFSKQRKKA